MKTFMDLALSRESCRKFTTEKVSDEQLLALAEAARIAPSARNSQPWEILLVNETKKAAQLIGGLRESGINGFLQDNLGYIVIVEKDLDQDNEAINSRKQRYAQLDIGIATAHIVLQAAEMGLATCVIGALTHSVLNEVLPVESRFGVAIVVAVGYAQEGALRPKKRETLDEVAKFVK